MKLNTSNLPEKEFFTFNDISERWECSEEQLEHYIFEMSILRSAIKTEGNVSGIVITDHAAEVISSEQLCELALLREENPEAESKNILKGLFTPSELESISMLDGWDKGYPKYLYSRADICVSDLEIRLGDSDRKTVFLPLTFDDKFVYLLPLFKTRKGRDKVWGKNKDRYSDLVFPTLYEDHFDIITKEERDRFELEYGINESTENVQRQVSKKTENKYLEIIKVLSESLLNRGLSTKPHTDAKEIDRIVGKRKNALPCTTETLAKYLERSSS